jgi:hypothetical protein
LAYLDQETGPMAARRRLDWRVIGAIALMLAALFAYLASLDDSDPELLPEAADTLDPGGPR